MTPRAALVLAPPARRDPIVTGLTLGERARRVAARAGVAADRVYVVRTPDDLSGARAALDDAAGAGALLVIRATDQVVADSLVAPLVESAAESPVESPAATAGAGGQAGGVPAPRIAVDPRANGAFAGALCAAGDPARELLDRLAEDLQTGDRAAAGAWTRAVRVEVDDRARHPAGTPEEVRAAIAWQYELVNKPLDGWITVRIYRPLARPLTRMFLRLPFSPNAITLLSAALSLLGCAIAAGSSYWAHIAGLVVLFAGGIVDCNDGEVARLRLEGSKLGGWLDAIGDDLARLALILAVGLHVAPRHPDWPILGLTIGAIALTLASMLLIYWYCVFVIHSSNNQDYGAVLGIGPGNTAGERTLAHRIGDVLSQIARRDFFDLAALGLALLGLPELTFAGLAVGSVVGLAIVLPTHIRIVQSRREAAVGAVESA